MTNATKHFLTIDNGGTNTKVIIVDQDGRQLSVSSFPTDAIERRPGFREVNPGQMWRDIGKAVKAALESAGLDGSQIDGVVPVGHGKGLLLVVEGEHVGGVVLVAVFTVEPLAFLGADDAHRDFRIHCQRMAYPARHFVARQGGAVCGSIARELQGQGELV